MSEDREPYGFNLRPGEDIARTVVSMSSKRLTELALQALTSMSNDPVLSRLPPLEGLLVLEFALGIYYQSCGALFDPNRPAGQMLPFLTLGYQRSEEVNLDVKCKLIERARIEHARIQREARQKGN